MKTKIFILLIAVFLTGCKTKKNIVDVKKERIEVKADIETEALTNNDLKTDSIVESGTKIVTTSSNEMIEATALNDSTEVVVEKKTEGNKTIWKIKGADTFKISDQEKTKVQEDTLNISVSKEDNTTIKKNEALKIDLELESKTKHSDRESTGMDPFTGIGIGLAIIFLLIYLYFRFRKSIL